MSGWGGFLSVCFQTTADTFDDAAAAFAQGDYTASLALLRPLAEQGKGDAQQALGLIYDLRYGVPQSFSTAVGWYRRAAEAGNPAAQFRLAFLYDQALGVDKDIGQAEEWYHRAAEQGLAPAEEKLAAAYFSGKGADRDYEKAWNWGKRAYADGDSSAVNLLCQIQKDGGAPRMGAAEKSDWCDLSRQYYTRSSVYYYSPKVNGVGMIPPRIADDEMAVAIKDIEKRADAVGLTQKFPSRYYAATTVAQLTTLKVLNDSSAYFILMRDNGLARIAVHGFYTSSVEHNEGVHIVPERNMPHGTKEGSSRGCSGFETVEYEVVRHAVFCLHALTIVKYSFFAI